MIEPLQRALTPLLAAGLASEQEIDYHPYGEDSPRLAVGRVQFDAAAESEKNE